MAQIREGHFNLYPLQKEDSNNDLTDDNATDNLLFAAFQSRMNIAGSDTTTFGAGLSGVLELDFFGITMAC